MSTINRHFTLHYSQPEDYHFSHDSVFLARYVFEIYKDKNIESYELLDLCSGCGIIGLDLLFHFYNERQQSFLRADFLEVQEIYQSHFQKNAALFTQTPTQFLPINYNQLHPHSPQYDLIVCNPPYFQPTQGKLSPSEFKNRCRFFLDSDLPHLLNGIEYSLKPTGQAFVLLKNLEDHNQNTLQEAHALCKGRLKFEKVHEIRGTDVIKVIRNFINS